MYLGTDDHTLTEVWFDIWQVQRPINKNQVPATLFLRAD